MTEEQEAIDYVRKQISKYLTNLDWGSPNYLSLSSDPIHVELGRSVEYIYVTLNLLNQNPNRPLQIR